jgi:hypothetical protein
VPAPAISTIAENGFAHRLLMLTCCAFLPAETGRENINGLGSGKVHPNEVREI